AAQRFREHLLVLRVGDRIAPATLLQRWLDLGYEPGPLVDGPGQIARRGGILDVFPPSSGGAGQPPLPFRIEFFGDEIDSIRVFDPETQRSRERVEQARIPPARERHAGEEVSTLLAYLPAGAAVLLDEPEHVEEVARDLERQAEELRIELGAAAAGDGGLPRYFTWDALRAALAEAGSRDLRHDPERETLEVRHLPVYGGRLKTLLDDLGRAQAEGEVLQVVVSQQSARLAELLAERGIVAPRGGLGELDLARARLALVQGALEQGFFAPALGFAVLTDAEIFGWSKPRRAPPRRRAAAREAFLAELQAGDWVVHVDHGVGRFLGLVSSRADGGEREFLLLEYAAGDRLYVPIEQADRVSRYVGAGDYTPQPTRLGTGEWTRAKQRVRRAVRDIARDLIALYAARQDAQGHAYPPDTTWQREMEAAFPYVETPDQLRAIDEVKQD